MDFFSFLFFCSAQTLDITFFSPILQVQCYILYYLSLLLASQPLLSQLSLLTSETIIFFKPSSLSQHHSLVISDHTFRTIDFINSALSVNTIAFIGATYSTSTTLDSSVSTKIFIRLAQLELSHSLAQCAHFSITAFVNIILSLSECLIKCYAQKPSNQLFRTKRYSDFFPHSQHFLF